MDEIEPSSKDIEWKVNYWAGQLSRAISFKADGQRRIDAKGGQKAKVSCGRSGLHQAANNAE